MSIPKRHHYVSRCLIEKFFNESGSVFLYDKIGRYFTSSTSSKKLFYEKGLNSKVTAEGEVDHCEVEEELNRYFEQDFPHHYNKIISVLVAKDDFRLLEMANTGELEESAYYLVRMGVIGDMRTPQSKSKSDKIHETLRSIILEHGTDNLKQELEAYEQLVAPVRYKTALDYNQLANEIIESMGEKILTIYLAPANDYFILPDCSSGTWRTQLIDDIIAEDGIRYVNPSREIALIGMPLNSKVFIRLESKKTSKEKENSLVHIPSNLVFHLNSWLYKSAHQRIACANELFLKGFIEQYAKTEH